MGTDDPHEHASLALAFILGVSACLGVINLVLEFAVYFKL